MQRIRLACSAVALFFAAGCTPQIPSDGSANTAPGPVSTKPVNLIGQNTGFSLPQAAQNNAAGYEVLRPNASIVPPTAYGPANASETSGDITFNFENASVSTVAQAIFGQILKQNYTVDGGAQGTITLQTTRPLSVDQVLPAFETSLQMANMALVPEADGYHIVPIANAAQAAAGNLSVAGGLTVPGYGYEVIPLQYANATSIQSLLQPLAQSGVQIQLDQARNLLVVSGTSQQRAVIAANVAVFDVDVLKNMSFALVPLQNASAPIVSKELDQILAENGSAMSGLVHFINVGQLNAILVISSQARYITEIKGWISRLDQKASSTERQVFIYRVQNGQAKDLAALLNMLLGQGGQTNQTQPDAGSSGADNAGASPPGQSQAGASSAAQSLLTSTAPLSQNQQAGPAGQDNQSLDSSGSGGSGLSVNDTDPNNQPPRIVADNSDNSLLILATPEQFRILQNAAVQMDDPPQQVMLEAVVAEVTLTNQLQYGVQYFFQSGRVQSINTLGSTAKALSEQLPGFSAILSPGNNIQVMLDALESITHVNVVSAPKLLVLNNQPAMLQVGDEVPITTQTAESTVSGSAPLVSTIQYQNTGVILHVTPRINAGGLVTLDMTQEVSEVSSTTSSTLNSPTISERKISTIVAVQDGQTVALGGLIQSNTNTSNSGIPLLDRIPVLGALFSNRNNSGTRTELLVMITPHVVQSIDSMQAVTSEVQRQLGDIHLQ